jgi:cytochrome c-type biogenesis protein CcmE
VQAGEAPRERAFRVGGLVKEGTLQRDRMTASFVITDTARDIPVRYTGILPDLFKEGRGAVAQGRLDAHGEFVATEVLAKHDENYMPPEAKHALDAARGGAHPARTAP